MSEIEGSRTHWTGCKAAQAGCQIHSAMQEPLYFTPNHPLPPVLLSLFSNPYNIRFILGKQIAWQTCISNARVQKSNTGCCQHLGLKMRRHRGAWTVPYLVPGLQLGLPQTWRSKSFSVNLDHKCKGVDKWNRLQRGRHQGTWTVPHVALLTGLGPASGVPKT